MVLTFGLVYVVVVPVRCMPMCGGIKSIYY